VSRNPRRDCEIVDLKDILDIFEDPTIRNEDLLDDIVCVISYYRLRRGRIIGCYDDGGSLAKHLCNPAMSNLDFGVWPQDGNPSLQIKKVPTKVDEDREAYRMYPYSTQRCLLCRQHLVEQY